MKDLFKLLGDYNKMVNLELIKIAEELPADDLIKDTKAFYKSIIGTLSHIMMSDTVWLRRFAENISGLADFMSGLPEYRIVSWEDILWKTLDEYKPVRIKTDETIIRICSNLSEEDLLKTITYKNWKGEMQTKILWRALLHMFNNETHHRGQIAALLDQMSVTNDYSNIIYKF